MSSAPTTSTSLIDVFRELHQAGAPLMLVNCWDAGSAKAIAEAGSRAVATSSWAVAAAAGYDDGEHVQLDHTLAIARQIAAGVDVPVSADLERGYASSADELRRVVADVVAAGVVGINIEDGLPTGLRAAAEQAARIGTVVDAAGDGLFVNARTDVFLTNDPADHRDLVDEALRRLHLYIDAGADGVFVPGLVDPGLVQRVVEETARPVNVMVSSHEQAVELTRVGVARISIGPVGYLEARAGLSRSAASWLSAIA